VVSAPLATVQSEGDATVCIAVLLNALPCVISPPPAAPPAVDPMMEPPLALAELAALTNGARAAVPEVAVDRPVDREEMPLLAVLRPVESE
jgi:hypothetical protein